jgi:hypothetical protein
MTKKDLAFTASRLIAVYLLIQVLIGLVEFPALGFSLYTTFSVVHMQSMHNEHDAVLTNLRTWNAMSSLTFLSVRCLAYSAGSYLFWKCGPFVERIFIHQDEDAAYTQD